MANQFKPLGPNSKIIEGRLGAVCFHTAKLFKNAIPTFTDRITEENHEDGYVVIQSSDRPRIIFFKVDLYNNSWGIFRRPNTFKESDLIVIACMKERNENDPIPERLITFRNGDPKSQTIQTKLGEREASFFSKDKMDEEWFQYTCGFTDLAKSVRSVVDGAVDPDITAGPFKSYLSGMLLGTPEKAANTAATDTNNPPMDFDDDIPF